jgi:hypothetical protein
MTNGFAVGAENESVDDFIFQLLELRSTEPQGHWAAKIDPEVGD